MKDNAIYAMARSVYHVLRQSRALRKVLYFGGAKYCPVCDSRIRFFLPPGNDPTMRYDSHCPVCHCKGPHRRNILFIEKLIASRAARRMLHIAPERAVAARLSRSPGLEYVSGDIKAGVGQLQFDIRGIPFEDEAFDFIYCCHVFMVLEDDMPAMTELCRVLREGGIALLEHPVDWNAPTLEAATVAERIRLFNDPAIVRLYGKDYSERLESAGLRVSFSPLEVTDEEMERMGLYFRHNVVCTRAANR